jgi:cell division protein FtsB
MKARQLKLFTNKYFLSPLLLLLWITFFDTNHVFSQIESRRQLRKLLDEREYYKTRITEVRTSYKELSTNPQTMEKYARERYYMKRNNEEIFLIVEEERKEEEKTSWMPGFLTGIFSSGKDTTTVATATKEP